MDEVDPWGAKRDDIRAALNTAMIVSSQPRSEELSKTRLEKIIECLEHCVSVRRAMKEDE